MEEDCEICSGCELDYFKTIAKFYGDNAGAVSFMRAHSVLPSSVNCFRCNHPCHFAEKRRMWRCHQTYHIPKTSKKKVKWCGFSVSDNKGTFLQSTHIEAWKVLLFTHHWLSDHWSCAAVFDCLQFNSTTACAWSAHCSEVAQSWVENQAPLGGPGVVVEADIIRFKKLKGDKSDQTTEIWLFGAIERVSKKKIIIPLFDPVLVKGALLPIIFIHILSGSVVYTYSGKEYACLCDHEYEHIIANNFEPLEVMKDLWGKVKDSINKPGMKPANLKHYIARFLFTTNPAFDKSRLHQFLKEAARTFPHPAHSQSCTKSPAAAEKSS